ncbi:GerMN domain-containing protein [Virgibacillus oceani]|uniref:Spore germination protein GerM n=1 Tax=Virgibacillus oceani TaxID=1479511 RepID=A0A917GZ76_9BACI|nr:GerMN domain-containing protein [Virgibacillus oceani]GGG62289.1 spore germination protein GerM [Virgibacillus oceani]
MRKQGTLLITGIMGISIILTGCFQGEQSMGEKVDPPQNAEPVNELENGSSDETGADAENDAAAETVKRQLFLIDANGMVAPQTLEIPKSESKEVAAQALEYLVKDGPVTNLLPNGFQAVLPAGTEILGLNLEKDGTMIVDVSSEFKNYEAADELKVLQAMTYTLTQFDSVNKVQLRIEGQDQTEMPVNGTPIAEGYSRANGINITETDALDLINSQAVTLYYPTEYNETKYFVPITKHIEVNDQDLYGSIVQTLLEGPGYSVNATQVFNEQASLTADPTLNNGVLELVFNQGILAEADKTTISDDVMESLVRTLTEQQSVEAVQVKVENVEKLFNENGEEYNKPVTSSVFSKAKKL